jgi:hypothetical protein
VDHSKDAQLIALAVMAVITLVLLFLGRKVKVTKHETTYNDASGTSRTLQRGWLVPPGAPVAADAFKEKKVSVFRMLYLGKDNRASTSKAVVLAWTYAIVYALISLLVAKWMGSNQAWKTFTDKGLQEEYLLLLGGPYAAAVIAKYTVVAGDTGDKPAAPNLGAGGTDAKNLVTDDDGETDLGDFQYVLFNLLALAVFLGSFIPHLLDALPDIPPTVTGLALTSAGGYAAKKAAGRVAGPQLTSIFPSSVTASTAATVEVFGRNLVTGTGDADRPRVSFEGVAAPAVSILATTAAGDRLSVTTPNTLAAGSKKVRVMTANGDTALTDGGTDYLELTVA